MTGVRSPVSRGGAGSLTEEHCLLYALIPFLVLLAATVYHWATAIAEHGVWTAPVYQDFLAFYTGGRLLLTGRIDSLYDIRAQEALQRSLVDLPPDGMTAFINPPFAVLLYAPFSVFHPLVGLLAWWTASIVLLILCLAWLRRALGRVSGRPGLSRYPLARLVGWAFLFHPTLLCLVVGQATAFLLLIHTAVFLLLRRRREFLAGLVLGCLLIKPQLGLGWTLLLLSRRRWRAVAGAVISCSVWSVVGYLLAPGPMAQFWELSPKLFAYIRHADFHKWGLTSLYGFGAALLDGLSTTAGSVVGVGLTVAATLLLLSIWRDEPWTPATRRWDIAMASSMALSLLVSPHLFTYDLTLLLVPLSIVLAHFGGSSGTRAVLDGGPVLRWTFWLCFAATLTQHVSMITFLGAPALGLPPFGIQASALVIAVWSWKVHRVSAQ